MADIGVFPALTGQGWSVMKTPTFQTRIQRAVSGRELRVADYPYPLWQFQLTYEAMYDGPAGGAAIGSLLVTDLRTLMGFFMACQGAFATFLYDDPSDDHVSGQVIGTGDGTTETFQLQRFFGPPATFSVPHPVGFLEPIRAPNVVSAVYLNPGSGPVKTAGWTVDPTTGLLTFGTAPPNGEQISADFSYYFRCRFMSDAYSFENFFYRLWSLKKLDFISVIA